MAVLKKGSKGVRVVRFKDFCYQDTGDSYTGWNMWAWNNGSTSWSINSGTMPYDALDGYGNCYKCDATVQSPSVLSVMASTVANATWASTDQGVKDFRSSVQYDVAMKADSQTEGAWFIFQWKTTGGVDYAYAVVLNTTEVGLYKISGADLTDTDNWTKLDAGARTPTADTWYWFRIGFVPADVVSGGRTFAYAGTLVVLVDEGHNQQGMGAYDSIVYVDETSIITDGTKLGLGAGAQGYNYFTGIEFCDDWIGQTRMPIAVNKFLLSKVSSHLMFSLAIMQEEFIPVSAGDRIEVWIAGRNDDDDMQRILDFDGRVQTVDIDSSNKRALVYATDEGFELTKVYRTQNPSSGTYHSYLTGTVLAGRAGGSRLPIQGIDTGSMGETISGAWGSGSGTDMSDADMLEFIAVLNKCITVWTPEGYLVCTPYIPNTFEFDNSTTPPQRIIFYKVWDDMTQFANRVVVKRYGGNSTDDDTPSKALYGEITRRELWTGAPSTEGGAYAGVVQDTFKDTHPFVRIGLMDFQPQFQPGCVVTVTLATAGLDSVPMMIVEKSYWNGEWKGIQPMGPPNTVIYTMAYYDTTASPLIRPRMPWTDMERFREWARQYLGDRKSLY